jgi:hypothetical protein
MMKPTAALVIETNNLGSGTAAEVADTLARLFGQLRRQTRPLPSLARIVVTHDRLSEADQARLCDAAGLPLFFLKLPEGTDYYEAKNLGFDAAEAEVVAFGDADCWPEPQWLEFLLSPFADPEVQAVAGRTSYRGDLLGIAATAVDFMYFASPLGEGCTRNFYANNVAFRRELFAGYRYHREDQVYRGHCQVLGLRLQRDLVKVRFEPGARTVHRFPDSLAELLRLRLLRGEDAVELTPHLARAYLKGPSVWLSILPGAPLGVLAARLAFSLRSLNRQDMPALSGARLVAAAAGVAGVTLADAAGALSRILGLDWGSGSGDAVKVSLRYHKNRDRLAA